MARDPLEDHDLNTGRLKADMWRTDQRHNGSEDTDKPLTDFKQILEGVRGLMPSAQVIETFSLAETGTLLTSTTTDTDTAERDLDAPRLPPAKPNGYIPKDGWVPGEWYEAPRFDEIRGLPMPGLELSVDDRQQLLAKAPSLFKEYYGRPRSTAECFDSEGFFCTTAAAQIESDDTIRVFGSIYDGQDPVPDIDQRLRHFLPHDRMPKMPLFWHRKVNMTGKRWGNWHSQPQRWAWHY